MNRHQLIQALGLTGTAGRASFQVILLFVVELPLDFDFSKCAGPPIDCRLGCARKHAGRSVRKRPHAPNPRRAKFV
jgi:hypothetical protein